MNKVTVVRKSLEEISEDIKSKIKFKPSESVNEKFEEVKPRVGHR